jgi:hypothetical protein
VKNKRLLTWFVGIVLFITSPFLLSYIYNEYLRINFQSNFYKKIETIDNKNIRLFQLSSQVYTFGNSDSCGYRAAIIFNSRSSKDLSDDLRRMKIDPVKSSSNADVELYVHNFGNLYVVIAEDGGYSSLLDLRCF